MATAAYHAHNHTAQRRPRCEEQAIRQARRDATALGLPAAVVAEYLSHRHRTIAAWRAWNTDLPAWWAQHGRRQ
jgi:hypothetical protein